MTTRYLGIEVGTGDLQAANWTKRLNTVKTRMGIASRIATGIADRIRVINAVSMPSILFTSKFFKPPKTAIADLKNLHRQYLWKGTTAGDHIRAHKIAIAIVHLPQRLGGMGMRNLDSAILKQAQMTIIRWNSRGRDKTWAAIDSLLFANSNRFRGGVYPAAKGASPTNLNGARTILQLGRDAINATMATRYRPTHTLLAQRAMVLHQWKSPHHGLQWLTSKRACFTIPMSMQHDWGALQRRQYSETPTEAKAFWESFPWYDNVLITDTRGIHLKRSDFPMITITTVAQLHIERKDAMTYHFVSPLRSTHIITSATITRLANWFWCIIGSYPHFLIDQTAPTRNRAYSYPPHQVFDQYEWKWTTNEWLEGQRLEHKWTNKGCPTMLRARCTGWNMPLTEISAIHDPEHQLNDFKDAGYITLSSHPNSNAGPTLDSQPRTRIMNNKRRYQHISRNLVTPKQHERGALALLDRLRRHQERPSQIHYFLQLINPNSLWAPLWGVTIYQVIFRYRLVVGALSMGSARYGHGGPCPYTCGAQRETIAHIIWECPIAAGVWRDALQRWTAKTYRGNLHNASHHCLTNSPPRLARIHLHAGRQAHPTGSPPAELPDQIWTILTRVIPQQLWLYRNAAVHQDIIESPKGIQEKIRYVYLNQITNSGIHALRSMETFGRGKTVMAIAHALANCNNVAPIEPSTLVRLMYDGGSRGNPGHAGAGFILLQRDLAHQWTTICTGSKYLGSTVTNNVAEHTALQLGLQAYQQRFINTMPSLEIVGDSALAQSQLLGRARIKHQRIKAIASITSSILSTIPDAMIHHTYRDGNKIADYLANMAMDRKTNNPPTTLETTQLAQFITNNISNDINCQHTPLRAITPMCTHIRRNWRLWTSTPYTTPTGTSKRPPPEESPTESNNIFPFKKTRLS
jgi:ribonuclease HI